MHINEVEQFHLYVPLVSSSLRTSPRQDMFMLGLFFQIPYLKRIKFLPTTYIGKLLKKDRKVQNSGYGLLLASSNGFLLLYEHPHYIISNPITKETIQLPESKLAKIYWLHADTTTGFLCKNISNSCGSYKVVQIRMLDHYSSNLDLAEMEFITNDMDDWEVLTLTRSSLDFRLRYLENPVISEESGVIYFPALEVDEVVIPGVFAYDSRKEISAEVEMIALPEKVQNEWVASRKWANHFGQTIEFLLYGLSYNEHIDFWVLDEHKKDWFMKYRIDSLGLRGIVGFHPLDPDKLFLWNKDDKLVSYNVKSRRMKLVPHPPFFLFSEG